MSEPYASRYAELYDYLYRSKPYGEETDFVHQCLSSYGAQSGSRLLELACGTGGHAVHFARLGYAVTATDQSPAMIEVAQKKAELQEVEITFEVWDMRELPTSEVPYDVVVCLFDSIGYVQTDSALAAVVDCVHANLRPDGLFVLEFWHAPAMLNKFEPVRVRRIQNGTTTILRISETTLEPERSLAHVSYDIYELRDDKTYGRTNECHTNRFFSVAEMEALGNRHGFVPLAAYSGFKNESAISDETWHVVAIWRKTAK
jgi:SAM-dependent methyltransferase